jgi:signal transduction histidine kinase
MLRTLRAKLVFSYAAISVLSLTLALAVTFALASDYAQRNGLRSLHEKRALALPYVQLVIREQTAPDPARGASRQALANVRESIRNSRMRLFLVNAETMMVEEDTSRRSNMIEQRFPLDDTSPDFDQRLSQGLEGTIQLPGENTRVQYVAQRLPLGPRPPNAGPGAAQGRAQPNPYILIVAQPEPGLREIVEQARGYIWPAVAIALIASILVGYLLARSIARPISRLATAATAIARGEYSHQVPVEGQGELALLSREFNDMAEEIGRSHQVQRDFIANVSHNLKTPLTSIQGFSQAMLEGALKDEAAYQQAAQIINVEAERMSRIVSQLLSLSRLQSGLAEMRPTELGPLLAQLVLAMQPRASEEGVELVFKAGQPTGVVLTDADRLKEAFGNLVENAIKFTPAGGTVTLQATSKRSEVEIEVTDTGKGIPQEDLSRVMERFYQVDKSRGPAVGQSVGLGLAITREIVLAHQGKIEIESSPGVGTTVRVILPSISMESASKPQTHPLKRHKVDSTIVVGDLPGERPDGQKHPRNGHDSVGIPHSDCTSR